MSVLMKGFLSSLVSIKVGWDDSNSSSLLLGCTEVSQKLGNRVWVVKISVKHGAGWPMNFGMRNNVALRGVNLVVSKDGIDRVCQFWGGNGILHLHLRKGTCPLVLVNNEIYDLMALQLGMTGNLLMRDSQQQFLFRTG